MDFKIGEQVRILNGTPEERALLFEVLEWNGDRGYIARSNGAGVSGRRNWFGLATLSGYLGQHCRGVAWARH